MDTSISYSASVFITLNEGIQFEQILLSVEMFRQRNRVNPVEAVLCGWKISRQTHSVVDETVTPAHMSVTRPAQMKAVGGRV